MCNLGRASRGLLLPGAGLGIYMAVWTYFASPSPPRDSVHLQVLLWASGWASWRQCFLTDAYPVGSNLNPLQESGRHSICRILGTPTFSGPCHPWLLCPLSSITLFCSGLYPANNRIQPQVSVQGEIRDHRRRGERRGVQLPHKMP
jgi:hypothetical protein